MKFPTLGAFSLFFALNCFTPTAAAQAVYAQLTSAKDQLTSTDTINQPIPIRLENVDDISGLDWNSDENKLTIKEDGTYFIYADAQVGARQTTYLPAEGGDLFFWVELNGKKVTNTGSWVHVSADSKSNYIADDIISTFKAGDIVRFMFSATTKDIGIITYRATELRPNAPGLSVSIYKLPDIS